MTATIALDRLLRRPLVADLLGRLAPEGFDVDGEMLRLDDAAHPTAPVVVDGAQIAEVVGGDARRVAHVLSAIAGVETERRRLADEVLNLYREINLLYDLADRLSGATGVRDLGDRMITEATRLVPADTAQVIVDDSQAHHVTRGEPLPRPPDLGRARIEAAADGAVLVAPMSVDGQQCGAIVLARHIGWFSAADLKLVSTVASQGGALVAGALDADRRQAAAARREHRLRAQIETLQIELDELWVVDEINGAAHVRELWRAPKR